MRLMFRGLTGGFLLSLLAACGGGGGGDSGAAGGSSSTPTLAAVVITTANAKTVGGNGLDIAQNTASAQTGASLVTGVTLSTTSAALPSYEHAAVAIARLARPMSATVAGVTFNETVSCSHGGTLSISGNVASSSGLFAGDSISFSASSCREYVDGILTTMSGGMSMSVASGSFTGATPYSVTLATTATNFSVTAGGVTSTANGDMQMAISGSATSETITTTGSAFTTTVNGRSVALRNYSRTVTIDILAGTVTASVSASVESSSTSLGAGGGKYTISTLTPLVRAVSSGNITAGSVRIVGASNSALLLTVTGTNAFSLAIDANGDGTYETTQTATAAELRALL